MRNIFQYFACFIVAALFALSAKAQIALDFKPESSRFLLGESVLVTLTIKNLTGGLLKFGAGHEEASLQLRVERYKGRFLPDQDAESPVAGLTLMPGETRSLTFNLARFICLSEIGQHQALACVTWRNQSYESKRFFFDIHKGVPLRVLTGGLASEPGVARNYTLKTLLRDGADYLYFSIGETGDENLYGLFPLGPFVRNPEPELQFDEAGNVHLLFKAAGGSFIYAAYTPFGLRLAGEVFHMTPSSRIWLELKPSGHVAVETVERREVAAATNSFALPEGKK